MVEYLTEQNSLSIKSLTDQCSGNDKLCISLYSELDLLGITEIGEILNVGKGGNETVLLFHSILFLCKSYL